MQIEEIDLDTALKLLDLPRVVGLDPESGEEITAQNGRYGPYLKKAADTRTLPSEDAIFEIDLPGALELFAQPKYGARRASSALKEFDNDPVSGKPIKVKDGRFGPYVTDGTTNATIPRAESVEDITFERAVELLQIKRDKGPAAPRAKRSHDGQEGARPQARGQEEHGVSRGLFITLEGGDGSGKTTQAELLRRWLATEGRVGRAHPGARAAPRSASRSARSCCTTAATSRRAPRRCSTRPIAPTTWPRSCGRRSSAARS